MIENKHKETAKSCSVIPSVSTDHEIIEIKLNIEKIKISPGFWKLNNRLLENEDYKLDIQNLISNIWEETEDISDTRIRFDYLKHKIMILSRKYSKTLAEKLRIKEFEAIETINKLDDGTINNNASDKDIDDCDRAKQEVETVKAKGAWVRSRTDKIELDEKSNKYFMGQERTFYDKKLISNLELSNWQMIEENNSILKEIKTFYQQLYSSTLDDEKNASIWKVYWRSRSLTRSEWIT